MDRRHNRRNKPPFSNSPGVARTRLRCLYTISKLTEFFLKIIGISKNLFLNSSPED